jgi:hypothetical protein
MSANCSQWTNWKILYREVNPGTSPCRVQSSGAGDPWLPRRISFATGWPGCKSKMCGSFRDSRGRQQIPHPRSPNPGDRVRDDSKCELCQIYHQALDGLPFPFARMILLRHFSYPYLSSRTRPRFVGTVVRDLVFFWPPQRSPRFESRIKSVERTGFHISPMGRPPD